MSILRAASKQESKQQDGVALGKSVRQRKNPNRYNRNEEQDELLCEVSVLMARGVSATDIAKHYRVSRATIYNWRKKIRAARREEIKNTHIPSILASTQVTLEEVIRQCFAAAESATNTRDKIMALQAAADAKKEILNIYKEARVYREYMNIAFYTFDNEDKAVLMESKLGTLPTHMM